MYFEQVFRMTHSQVTMATVPKNGTTTYNQSQQFLSVQMVLCVCSVHTCPYSDDPHEYTWKDGKSQT